MVAAIISVCKRLAQYQGEAPMGVPAEEPVVYSRDGAIAVISLNQ